jgi:hypothetical protein
LKILANVKCLIEDDIIKSKTMFKKISLTLLLSLLPAIALAQPAVPSTYDLISPLGTGLSTGVDLKTYLQGVIVITIGIAGVLAVVMMVICGIKMMMSGSVSGKSEAKECIWNAIFGLLIAIAAWAILYTINPELLKNDLQLADVPVPVSPAASPRTESNPAAPGCYFKYRRTDTGDIAFLRADTCPACEQLLVNVQTEPFYEIQSKCYEVKAGVATVPPGAGNPPPPISGVKCAQSGRNLCEGKPKKGGCTNPTCAQFAPMAARYAGGVATAELIKAIILEESSCGQNLTGIVTDSGVACGPTQFLPATAQKYAARCGVPNTTKITCGWLSNKANWDKAVCMTAEHLRALAQTQCGSELRNIAAGYNGGSANKGSCGASADCAGSSCSGQPYKRWECLYDDAAHTQCNGGANVLEGYNQTRNYATEVLFCAQNPGF